MLLLFLMVNNNFALFMNRFFTTADITAAAKALGKLLLLFVVVSFLQCGPLVLRMMMCPAR